MIVSVDMPEALIAKIDELVEEVTLPVWPFEERTILPDSLSTEDRKKLNAFQKAKAEYDLQLRHPSILRTRSAALRMIVTKHFE